MSYKNKDTKAKHHFYWKCVCTEREDKTDYTTRTDILERAYNAIKPFTNIKKGEFINGCTQEPDL